MTLKPQSHSANLIGLMQQLDRLLAQALAATSLSRDPQSSDPYRGLHLDEQDVEQALQPEMPLWGENLPKLSAQVVFSPNSRWDWLRRTFELTAFDLDVIALALAPEIDLRYERLYAYLQDDVTRKRPTVDLTLNLFSRSVAQKLAHQARFAPSAPLMQHQLLHLVTDAYQTQPPQLGCFLKLDDLVRQFLLGHSGLEPSLEMVADLTWTEETDEALPNLKQGLSAIAKQLKHSTNPALSKLYFRGRPGLGQQHAAAAMAALMDCPLLAVHLERLPESLTDFSDRLRRLWRTASFHQALLYLPGIDTLSPKQQGWVQTLLLTSKPPVRLIVLTGQSAWSALPQSAAEVIEIGFERPDFKQRCAYWQTQLQAAQIEIAAPMLDELAERPLSYEQIDSAIAVSRGQSLWRGIVKSPEILPTFHDLLAASRAQFSQLSTLARKISPCHAWFDLVLPDSIQIQLQEICHQVRYHRRVFEQWGFAQKMSLGRGLSALFTGPPGTGKTMAAEVIAQDLQLDLYKIDLSQVVSKYIGETEKNLDRVFTAARDVRAILFFDEADAIFGKRSEVKDAHDRYANLEVAYLLQKMEEFEGISILTSNLRQNMDEAFVRRIRFIVNFSVPNQAARLQIWQRIFPPDLPKAELALPLLAKQFELTGGSIRNVALAAAFLAAAEDQPVTMPHILQAVRQEFQKMGRLIDEADFAPFVQTLANLLKQEAVQP